MGMVNRIFPAAVLLLMLTGCGSDGTADGRQEARAMTVSVSVQGIGNLWHVWGLLSGQPADGQQGDDASGVVMLNEWSRQASGQDGTVTAHISRFALERDGLLLTMNFVLSDHRTTVTREYSVGGLLRDDGGQLSLVLDDTFLGDDPIVLPPVAPGGGGSLSPWDDVSGGDIDVAQARACIPHP